MKAGAVYKYDLSIPVENMYNLVEEMRVRLGKKIFKNCPLLGWKSRRDCESVDVL